MFEPAVAAALGPQEPAETALTDDPNVLLCSIFNRFCSFAVTAMAEAAVARKLNVAGGSVRLSVQDVAFCPEDPREPRFCLSMWSLLPALAKFQNGDVVAERCLGYTAASEGNDDAGSKCK